MKKSIALLFVLAAMFFAGAAAGPTYTQAYAFVNRSQVDPGNNGTSATPTTFIVQAYFSGHFVNDAQPTDTHDIGLSGMPVAFDMLASTYKAKTATAGGITATYEQIALLTIAAETAEYNAQVTAMKAAGKKTGP